MDDLLDETCRQGLRALVQIYRSRTLRCAIPPKDRKTIRGLEQFYFETAFSELLERPPFRVQRWIQHGNEEVNLVRFSFGMGVRSIWAHEAISLVRALALGKEALLFWDHAGKPCFAEIKRIVDGFEWSAEWVLPQI